MWMIIVAGCVCLRRVLTDRQTDGSEREVGTEKIGALLAQ